MTLPVEILEKELDAWDVCIRDFYARLDHPIASIVDARRRGPSSAMTRKRFAEIEKATASQKSRYVRGQAFVMATEVGRGALTAIQWISPPPYPYKVFGDLRDAEAWCRACLAGVDLVGSHLGDLENGGR